MLGLEASQHRMIRRRLKTKSCVYDGHKIVEELRAEPQRFLASEEFDRFVMLALEAEVRDDTTKI